MRLNHLRPTATAALAAAGALALAACGGSGSAATTGTAAAGAAAGRPNLASAEVQACLKKQGVTLPGRPPGGARTGTTPDGGPPPGFGGAPGGLPGAGGAGGPRGNLSDAERQKLQAAMKACGVQFRGGGPGGRPSVTDPAYRTRITAYVACVRKNGFDLPDPNLSGNGPVFDASKVDQGDPAFQKASAACQSLLRPPGAPQGAAPGSATTTTPQ